MQCIRTTILALVRISSIVSGKGAGGKVRTLFSLMSPTLKVCRLQIIKVLRVKIGECLVTHFYTGNEKYCANCTVIQHNLTISILMK